MPEANDESYRELFFNPYRLIYRITQNGIEVIAFVHGARDLGRLWPEY